MMYWTSVSVDAGGRHDAASAQPTIALQLDRRWVWSIGDKRRSMLKSLGHVRARSSVVCTWGRAWRVYSIDACHYSSSHGQSSMHRPRLCWRHSTSVEACSGEVHIFALAKVGRINSTTSPLWVILSSVSYRHVMINLSGATFEIQFPSPFPPFLLPLLPLLILFLFPFSSLSS